MQPLILAHQVMQDVADFLRIHETPTLHAYFGSPQRTRHPHLLASRGVSPATLTCAAPSASRPPPQKPVCKVTPYVRGSPSCAP